MYPQLGLHIDPEMEFRIIFGPREGPTARGAALGARTHWSEDPKGLSMLLAA